MGVLIVLPNIWLTASLCVVCLVFLFQFIGKSKVKKAFMDNILMNKQLVDWLGTLLFLALFISSLYLIQRGLGGKGDAFVAYFPYFIGVALSLGGGAMVDNERYDRGIPMSIFLGSNCILSLIGVFMMVMLHFSYMWYMLGFLGLSFILMVWKNRIR